MSTITLISIILYSGWHYSRILLKANNKSADLNFVASKLLFLLLTAYLIYERPFLFFAITSSKLIYDLVSGFFKQAASGVPDNELKDKVVDGLVGILIFIISLLG